MMKKIALSAIGLSLVLAGCTLPNTNSKPESKPLPRHPHQNSHQQKPSKEQRYGNEPAFYACEQGTRIAAKYDSNNQIAKLRINAKTLGLDNQEVELKQAPSGSGVRYINDKNPASIYEWHTKGNDGVLTIIAGSGNYRYSCKMHNPR